MKDRYCKGITMVEALVAAVLIVIMSAAVVAILLAGSDSWQIGNVKIQLQQELRKAKSIMADELRQTGPDRVSVLDGGPPEDDIVFQKAIGATEGGVVVWSDNIQFLLSGPTSNELHRLEGLSDEIVAQHISSMQFVRQVPTPYILEVTLMAQLDTLRGRTVTSNLNFKIFLRN